MHTWYLGGIDHRPFLHLVFEMSARAPRSASSVAGPANGGHPCRISLSDPAPGSELPCCPTSTCRCIRRTAPPADLRAARRDPLVSCRRARCPSMCSAG